MLSLRKIGDWKINDAAVVVFAMLCCLWGSFAYFKMEKELLPSTSERIIVAIISIPGLTAEEIKFRIAEPTNKLLSQFAPTNGIAATYYSHFAAFQIRSSEKEITRVDAFLLKKRLADICKLTMTIGCSVQLKNEPLADRTSLILGVPTSTSSLKISQIVEGIRKKNGVAQVLVTDNAAAWTNAQAFKVIEVTRREAANPVEINDNILKDLDNTVKVFSNEADYIHAAENNLYENVLGGTILTVICVFLFVRKFYSTFVIGLSIPVCLLLTLPILYIMGVSKNVMSMAGMALSVGIVVDSTLSVVMDFNELMASGKYRPQQAAYATVKASFVPLVVSSLSTSAVFLPILFLKGNVGKLFSDLSLAVIVSNFVGLIVSLAVTPSILSLSGKQNYSLLKRKDDIPNKFQIFYINIMDNITRNWRLVFSFCTEKPLNSLTLVILSLTLVVLALRHSPPSEFLPPPRSGPIFAQIKQPETHIGTWSSSDLASISQKLLKLINNQSGKDAVLIRKNSLLAVTFNLEKEKISEFRKNLQHNFPSYETFVAIYNPLKPLEQQTEDVGFFLQGNPKAMRQFKNWMLDNKLVEDVSFAGVTSSQAMQNLTKLPPEVSFTQPMETLRRFSSEHFKISGDINISLQPSELAELDGSAASRISAKLSEKETNISFIKKAKEAATRYGTSLLESKDAKESADGIKNLTFCLMTAIIIIFFTLLAQNRSKTKSCIILATFIWAPMGAIPGLLLHRETLNGSALVGFILLAGTIVNNGILLMDRIEKNLQLQMAPFDAARVAVEDRFINVVITGLTTILAMLPMISGGQEGAQMYRSLSIVVVYGTLASTPISFLGIPALLTLRNWAINHLFKLKIQRKVATMREKVVL